MIHKVRELLDEYRILRDLWSEIKNFEEIASVIVPSPGDIPSIEGVDIYGSSLPLKGVIGGDHVIYVDFNKRLYDLDARIERALSEGKGDVAAALRKNRTRAGICVLDVAGHKITDAFVSGMLHQAFLALAATELDHLGEITTGLFETLNNRVYKTTSIRKFVTMIYGEISSSGVFRYINAAHPPPAIYSEGSLTYPQEHRTKPLGLAPSRTIDAAKHTSVLGFADPYRVNQLELRESDILLLYTDGLQEHGEPHLQGYRDARLQDILHETWMESAKDIQAAILEDVRKYAKRNDDITCVVVKKT